MSGTSKEYEPGLDKILDGNLGKDIRRREMTVLCDYVSTMAQQNGKTIPLVALRSFSHGGTHRSYGHIRGQNDPFLGLPTPKKGPYLTLV